MKTETIICECGVSFEWTPMNNWAAEYLHPDHCPECAKRIENEWEEECQRKRIAEIDRRSRMAVLDATSALFRATDTGHPKFNVKGWNKAMNWHPTVDKPWLGLIGETGTCKSRIAYMLAADVIERITSKIKQPPSFEFIAAYKISDLVGRLSSSSFEDKDKARTDLARQRETDLLLIDDLGKGRMSPSVAAEMFALIDHRYCHALPTIWTANSLPDDFAAVMPSDIAAPLAGRLNDSSRIIRFR